ncbi:hypothetical protein DENSPDRAFT_447816 [Dentipellis sp. KUC8613]|nr:hypothetical protein DENSPDRAFT_447816 [Dentipellis sp. KUC8613]
MSSQYLEPPPLDALKLDDPAEVDAARLRVNKRNTGLLSAISLPQIRHSWHGSIKPSVQKGKRRASTSEEPADGVGASQSIELPHDISLKDASLPDDKDVYRWAVVYENQRGVTLFSSAYYSPQSLLPIDPPAFTLADAVHPRDKHAGVSLNDYSLPDGTWRWVSNTWMIDMPSEGEVQYDGFEYNWFFRKRNWRAQVGTMSAGGWVRRRRWVRLMMRPASVVKASQNEAASILSSHASSTTGPELVVEPPTVTEETVWKGDAGDWERCWSLMKGSRDGRRLEIWKIWLLDCGGSHGSQKGKERQREEQQEVSYEQEETDDVPETAGRPSRQQVVEVLNNHGSEILQMFVYPQSRVDFINLLADAHLLRELNPTLSSSVSQTVNFWSYSAGLSPSERTVDLKGASTDAYSVTEATS